MPIVTIEVYEDGERVSNMHFGRLTDTEADKLRLDVQALVKQFQ
jgi:hypothetical protein